MIETEKREEKTPSEFKIPVIMDMRHNHLKPREIMRKYWNASSRGIFI